MTLHDNICDVARSETLTASAIAAKLLLPSQDVCRAIAELLVLKRIRCAGKIWVPMGRMQRTLPIYTIARPAARRDKHAEKMNRLRREFLGGEA